MDSAVIQPANPPCPKDSKHGSVHSGSHPSSPYLTPQNTSTHSSTSSYKTSHDHARNGPKNTTDHAGRPELLPASDPFRAKTLTSEVKPVINHPIDEEPSPGPGRGPSGSPENSVYSATMFTEAQQSFSSGSGSSSQETGPASFYRWSDGGGGSSPGSFNSAVHRPHKQNDERWEAVQAVRARAETGLLEMKHFRHVRRLGCGDIGRVYLSELVGTGSYFATKVMDKAGLAGRNKLPRAQTEREILQSLDHPFLPTLYACFETEKLSCLVMEYCPGGDLHAVRQRQPGKCFSEHAARFYVAEVLLALEYLHMLGIIYRDLKPENVLVREDGHIMLSDFDLSLRCVVNPKLVRSANPPVEPKPPSSGYCVEPSCILQPACFGPRFARKDHRKPPRAGSGAAEVYHQATPLPELVAEPTSARSMSFVGTHEYLAPEIIKGEGHGSAVDWWTLGVFLYELLFGKTPFKGAGNRATLFNVVGHPLRFPETPSVSFAARDLIRGLLVKEPEQRLAYRRGAAEIKQHPFFQSVNWALIRCSTPPDVPRLAAPAPVDAKPAENYLEIDFF